jgi:undecaprenyl-phosphate galactose phosphotransferase
MDIVLSFFVLIFIYPLTFLIPSSIKKRSMIIKMISQVYKVLIGKLSFVGPKETINDFNLFLGKQGLTGLWFIENDDDSVRLDIFYAKNQNIWLDLEILGKTISKILFNRY